MQLIPAARAVNDAMPLKVADLLKDALKEEGKSVEGARIAILGYAYLEESDDTRNSPSALLLENLKTEGAEVFIHDPYVPEFQKSILDNVDQCDAVIMMVAHQAYRDLDLKELGSRLRTLILIDGRRIIDPMLAQKAGLSYYGIGFGRSKFAR